MRSYYVLKIQYVDRPPETRNLGAARATLGRESGDLVLGDPQTSGRHAELLFEVGQLRVRDLGSTNGTWFDGERQTEFVLEPGQWFQTGQTTIQLVAIHHDQPHILAAGSTVASAGASSSEPPALLQEASRALLGPSGHVATGARSYAPIGFTPVPAGGASAGAHAAGAGAHAFGASPSVGAHAAGAGAHAFGASPSVGAHAAGADAHAFGASPSVGAHAAGAGAYAFGASPSVGAHAAGAGAYAFGASPSVGAHAAGADAHAFGASPSAVSLEGRAGGPAAPASAGAVVPNAWEGVDPHGHGAAGVVAQGAGDRAPEGQLYGQGAAAPPQYASGSAPSLPPYGSHGVAEAPHSGNRGVPVAPPHDDGSVLAAPPYGSGGESEGPLHGRNGAVAEPAYGGGGMPPGPPPYGSGGMSAASYGNRGGIAEPGAGASHGSNGAAAVPPYGSGGVPATPHGSGGVPATPHGSGGAVAVPPHGNDHGGLPALAVRGVRPHFQGYGGELFVTFLAGYVLTLLTVGIYAPWFYCRLTRYVLANTTLGPTRRGAVRLDFTGRGGELFVTVLVGYLLTLLTAGIYGAWFATKLMRFFSENVVATAEDGTRYSLRFEGQGGEFFTLILGGYLLTLLTLGIYAPWFLCKFRKLVATRTVLLANERPVGSFGFEGRGGELFSLYLAGYLLTIVTLGLYLPWLSAKVTKFFAANSRVQVEGRVFAGAFHGTGSELFTILLAGYVLTALSVGIYLPWFLVKLWNYQFNHHEYVERTPMNPTFALPYPGAHAGGGFLPMH